MGIFAMPWITVPAGGGQHSLPLLLNNNWTTKTNKEHDVQQMFLCHSGSQKKQEYSILPEINNASYQEEKTHNDPFPVAVMTLGSSLSKELNTGPNYSISGGNNVHKAVHRD
jgi:hypothetical protein